MITQCAECGVLINTLDKPCRIQLSNLRGGKI